MRDLKFWKLFAKNIMYTIGILFIIIVGLFIGYWIKELFIYNDMYGFILLGVIAIIGLITGKSMQDYKIRKYN